MCTLTPPPNRWVLGVVLLASTWVGAGDYDWSQRYGDGANTNTSPCWLQPPLVEVWRQGLPSYAGASVAASGVWCVPLRSGPTRVAGISAATGIGLWGVYDVHALGVSVVGDRVCVQLQAPGIARTPLRFLDLMTGCSDRGAPPWAVSFRGDAAGLLDSPVATVDDDGTLLLSSRRWVGVVSLAQGAWRWQGSVRALMALMSNASPDGIPGMLHPANQMLDRVKPATDGQVAVIGPYSGWLMGLGSLDGRPLWLERPGGESVPFRSVSSGLGAYSALKPGLESLGSVTLGEGAALCPMGDGGVAAYTAGSGDRLWTFKDALTRTWRGMPRPYTPYSNLALARSVGAVLYPSFDGRLYCLDLERGSVRWAQPWVFDLFGKVATPDYCYGTVAPVVTRVDAGEVAYLSDSRSLRAFDVRDGRVLWQQGLPLGTCAPAVHAGALYLTSGPYPAACTPEVGEYSASCFAPAVRLYRLGYGLPADLLEGRKEDRPAAPWPKEWAPEALKLSFSLADEAVDCERLRDWLAKQDWPHAGCRLLVSLNWLNDTKDDLGLPEAAGGRNLDDAAVVELVGERCAELARTFKPAHFDIGPECNYYLHAHPEKGEQLLTLLRHAGDRVKNVSPQTQVLVTLQYELWQGWNSHLEGAERKPGRLRSLGALGPNEKLTTQFGLAQAFDKIVDCLGISTDPAAICAKPADLPLDYYCRLANAMNKPLLFTDVRWPAGADGGREAQKEFVDVFSRRIYWLDPQAVIWPAYDPDAAKELGYEGYSLAAAKDAAPPKAWQDLVGWRTLPHRPQPGPPIVLAKAEEGF